MQITGKKRKKEKKENEKTNKVQMQKGRTYESLKQKKIYLKIYIQNLFIISIYIKNENGQNCEWCRILNGRTISIFVDFWNFNIFPN